MSSRSTLGIGSKRRPLARLILWLLVGVAFPGLAGSQQVDKAKRVKRVEPPKVEEEAPASVSAPAPAEPAPAEPVSREPVSREPVSREPVPREPVPREPVPRERVVRGEVPREPPRELAPDETIYSEALDVTVANIDVFVSDKRGEPVRGLDQSDFELQLGGKGGEELPITHFLEVSQGMGPSGSGAAEPLTVVVFVDNSNLRVATRDQALAELEPGLSASIAAGAKMMVVAFDENLEVLLTLGESPTELRGVLQRIRLRPAADARFETRDRGLAESVRTAMTQMRGTARERRIGVSALDNLRNELRGAAESEQADVARALDALESVIGSLSGVPGRKALFYLSEGLAMRPYASAAETLQGRSLVGRNTTAGEEDFMGQGGIPDNQVSSRANEIVTPDRNVPFAYGRLSEEVVPFQSIDRFEQLAAMANSRRVGIYPVIAAPGDVAAAQSRDNTRGGGVELSDRREGLELLALRTAARARTSATSVEGFVESALGELEDYYSIGFSPPDDVPAGTFLPLSLDVATRGEVRYRRSLLVTTFEQRLADRLVAALILGLTDNSLELEYEMADQTGLSNGNFSVDLQISLPIRVLELVEQGGSHNAQARVVAAALTTAGRVREVKHLDLPLSIPEADLEAALAQYFAAVVRLELPPGSQRVAIGLWDRAAGRGSFLRQDILVGARTSDQ